MFADVLCMRGSTFRGERGGCMVGVVIGVAPTKHPLFEDRPGGGFIIRGTPPVEISIARGPSPGVVWMAPHHINEGPSTHPRIPKAEYRSDPSDTSDDEIDAESGERRGRRYADNPFANKDGWRLVATGAAVEAKEGITGSRPTSKRLATIYSRIPNESRIWLWPYRPERDPLGTKKTRPEPWISDSCIMTLLRASAAIGLKFAVPPTSIDEIKIGGKLVPYEKNPSQMLQRAAIRLDGDNECALVPTRKGMTLAGAAAELGMRDPSRASPEDLYSAYVAARRAGKARAHDAYHRILMQRFLERRLIAPRSLNRSLDRELERRANLLQAHRLFVFDSRGCPVSINAVLVREYAMNVSRTLGRHVTQPRLLQKTDTWGQWLFSSILRQDPNACTSRAQEKSDMDDENKGMLVGAALVRGLLEGTIAIG